MGQFVTYAQNNEDAIIAAYFKDVPKGVYVDIGANHPVQDSVTKHFYDAGWRGINVEPIRALHGLLTEHRPEDTNVRAGISDIPGTLKLREYANDGMSTFSSDIKRQHAKTADAKTATYQDVEVPVITLKQLFEQHPLKHIHFMKIDVEGFEYEVIKGNDWKRYRPELICIEANHPVHDWRPLLAKEGYTKVWNDGLNDYYLAKESMHRRAYFSYPEVMLLSEQIIPYHVVDHIERLRTQVHDEEVKTQVQQLRVKQLEHENNKLSYIIQEQQRFSKALLLLLRAADRVILTQIERLHKPKAGRIVRPNASATHYDASSKEALLDSIRMADLHAYYSFQKRSGPQTFYLYHILLTLYLLPQRAVRKAYRGVRQLRAQRSNHAN